MFPPPPLLVIELEIEFGFGFTQDPLGSTRGPVSFVEPDGPCGREAHTTEFMRIWICAREREREREEMGTKTK